jgi:carboxyl-terminal processing protease
MKSIKSIILVFCIASLTLIINSCSNDDTAIKDPRRYTASDIKSYSDLFEVFWTTMDQRYNYFFEQKEISGLDWDKVYKDYKPKFEALKTYGRSTENDQDIYNDYLKAKDYFSEIVNPIIDRHFYVQISLPYTSKGIVSNVYFYGDMLNETQVNTHPFAGKFNIMSNRVNAQAFKARDITIAGNLIANPDVFYFSFSSFNLSTNYNLSNLFDDYLVADAGNALLLTEKTITEEATFNTIQSQTLKNDLKTLCLSLINEWQTLVTTSPEAINFRNELKAFKNTEVMREEFLTSIVQLRAKTDAFRNKLSVVATYVNPASQSLYVAESRNFVSWFSTKMVSEHTGLGYNYSRFTNAQTLVTRSKDFYKNFLNPLHKGDIKKIVIDLRGNGGGAVLDARFISDRFVTKNTVFAYQRSKEGSGRFDYTPWVEARTNPHKFGIPANIPIVILTDRGSASMSEITTLMLKAQGNHVISVGDYSAGATAGLGTTDDFNGGTRDAVAGGILNFYMPLLAMKDAAGNVVEGIGIKPDIAVEPLTDSEVSQVNEGSSSFVDRALDKALEYLSTK